ncbi:alpha-amylase, partial [Cryptococcus neoformans A1-35-8]
GEVLLGTADYVANYQNNGDINPFNYPIYYPLISAFNGTNQDFTSLVDMVATVKSNFSDPTLLGSFLDNHDNPRFESYQSDTSLIKNAHAYPLVTDGIPYVYYGSEAGYDGGADPLNREPLWTSNYDTTTSMYGFFTALNAARTAAANASSTFYTDQMTVSKLSDTSILIAKKPLISVLSNSGSSASNATVTVDTSSSGWAASTSIVDTLTCEAFTTDASGNLDVVIYQGLPRVMIESSSKGSLCGSNSVDSSSSSDSAAGLTAAAGGWAVAAGVAVAGLQVLL